MDKKKITRRVALGTAAGAVASSPMIFRALKGRYQADAPTNQYETEWGKCIKMIDIPIKPIDGPSQFTLDYRPDKSRSYRGISLFASYDRFSHPAQYPQAPFYFSVGKGQIACLSPIVDNRPAYSISAEERVVRSYASVMNNASGQCIVVPDDGNAKYYKMHNNVPKRIELHHIGPACRGFVTALAMVYPRRKVLTTGAAWNIPKSLENRIEFPCKIVGFIEVAGQKTVHISAEKHVSHKDIQQHIADKMQQVKMAKIDKITKERMKEAIEGGKTKSYHLACYVNLDTGTVVRYEGKAEVRYPNLPGIDHTTYYVVQMLS